MPALTQDAILFAYLAGALEPGPHNDVERALGADPALRAHLSALSAQLREAPPASPWRIPPPGVGFGLRASAHPVAVMGANQVNPGDRVAVHLAGDASGVVVVLQQQAHTWNVVFPTAPDDAVDVTDLPRTADGERRLDLVAGAQTGTQRWAVVVVPELDWQATNPFAELQQAVARGDVAIASVQFDVSP